MDESLFVLQYSVTKMAAEFALYRLRDSEGALIYVGATCNLGVRMTSHKRKHWWPQVDMTRSTVEWFETVEDVAAAELAAIANESPRHNGVGAPAYGGHR